MNEPTQYARIGELAEVIPGFSPRPDERRKSGRYLLLGGRNIKGDRLVLTPTDSYVEQIGRASFQRAIARPGDLIASTLFDRRKLMLYTADDLPAVINNSCAIIRSASTSDYIVSYLRTMQGEDDFDYTEASTGFEWRLTCGGTRAYAVRIGSQLDRDPDSQAADSHFMMRRITSSLLLGGLGLFQAEPVGRLVFKDLCAPIKWTSVLDLADPLQRTTDDRDVGSTLDWCRALCRHTALRRSADDAHLALTLPLEAFVFIYRGLEWLKHGFALEWTDLARDMNIPESELRELKKVANHETGVRHASTTGVKLRAEAANYGTWVCGLIDAINAARRRIEPAYTPMSPQQVGQAVMKAVPVVPYE